MLSCSFAVSRRKLLAAAAIKLSSTLESEANVAVREDVATSASSQGMLLLPYLELNSSN